MDAEEGAEQEDGCQGPGEGKRTWFESGRLLFGELELGNRLFTYAARVWLGRDAGVAATGTLESISDRGGGAFEATVALTMKGTTHRVDASGAISKVGEALSLVGITKVHPRDVGVPLPRRGTPMVHCHWDLHLVRDTE